MTKILDSHVQAAGILLTIGALLFVVGLFAHPPESVDAATALATTARTAGTWRAVHGLITAGSAFVAAGALLVLGARTRLTDTGLGTAAWALLAVALVVFIPVPALEATVAVDTALAGDAASFGLIGAVTVGLVQTVPLLLAAIAAIAFTEARRAPSPTLKGAAAVGGLLALVTLGIGAAFLWFGYGAAGGYINQLFALAFLWPVLLGITLARSSGAQASTSHLATA